jgi:hypothetical protein
MRRVRIVLGITILILSVALLVWGFLPARRETRRQPISPIDLQLPTPASFDTQMNPFIYKSSQKYHVTLSERSHATKEARSFGVRDPSRSLSRLA